MADGDKETQLKATVKEKGPGIWITNDLKPTTMCTGGKEGSSCFGYGQQTFQLHLYGGL